MSERSFAGFSYRDRLHTGVFGQVYRAETASGNEVRLLEVDEGLAQVSGFADVLTSRGSNLARLDHPNVVGTRMIGRAPDSHMVVVTEVAAGDPLDELLGLIEIGGRRGLPVPMAAIVGCQMLAGLAEAHARDIVHGALHPRSVSIDRDGLVRIDHFAVGRALAEASAQDGAPSLFKGFSGFLAPELALGDVPDAVTDVYAAGAVLFSMLTGWAPPREIHVSPAIKAVILRALDTDRAQRYDSAAELLTALEQALEEDGWQRASRKDLADHIAQARSPRARSTPTPTPLPGHLSNRQSSPAIERPSASSPAIERARTPGPGTTRLSSDDAAIAGAAAASAEMALAAIASLDDDKHNTVRMPSVPAHTAAGEIAAAAADSALAAVDKAPDTDRMPSSPDAESTDPIELIDLGEDEVEDEDEDEKEAEDDSGAAPSSQELAQQPPARPSWSDSASAPPGSMRPSSPRPPAGPPTPPAPVAPVAPATPANPGPAAPALPVLDRGDTVPDDLTTAMGKRRRLSSIFWLLALVGMAGVLVWVVRHQGTLREQAAQIEQESEAAQEEALRRLREDQPVSGQIQIDSEPGEAAVWMLLGRTPLDTVPFSASLLHELRLEFEGHQPLSLRVEAEHWSGTGDALRAGVRGTLEPGTPARPVPAYPPEPPPEASRGLPASGSGPIHVESTPPGAQVWLLVGFTPDAEISGQAGLGYELKIIKDGHLPGFVVIRPDEWTDPEGDQPISRLTRSVELTPRKQRGKGRAR